MRINANDHWIHWGSNRAETIPSAHCGSNHRIGVEIHSLLTTIRISSWQGRSPTRQLTKHLTKTIDRVPEVQGLLFAPCTVGPCGLPNRPPIYSQRPRRPAFYSSWSTTAFALTRLFFVNASQSLASFVASNQDESTP
jgi:hypothetical protein